LVVGILRRTRENRLTRVCVFFAFRDSVGLSEHNDWVFVFLISDPRLAQIARGLFSVPIFIVGTKHEIVN